MRQEPAERVDARRWELILLPTGRHLSRPTPKRNKEVYRLRSSLFAIWAKDQLRTKSLALFDAAKLTWAVAQGSRTCGGVADAAHAAVLSGRYDG